MRLPRCKLDHVNYICSVQFTVFHFVVHYAYFSCKSCLQDFTFLNINHFSNTDNVNAVF